MWIILNLDNESIVNISIPSTVAVSDSGFVFLSSTGETFTLNEVGRFIYRQFHEGVDVEDVTRNTMEEFDVERNALERDLSEFIAQLMLYGLLERR